MLDDQQRLTEAYKLVQEAAPAGWGEQLGTWIKGKAVGALGPLGRGLQQQVQGNKDFQKSVNDLKGRLQNYKGQLRISAVTGPILSKFLAGNNMTVKAGLIPTGPNKLSDADINKILIAVSRDNISGDELKGGKKPTNKRAQKPAAPNTPKQVIDQNKEAEAIAQQLRTTTKYVRGNNVLAALAKRGLELTKK